MLVLFYKKKSLLHKLKHGQKSYNNMYLILAVLGFAVVS